MMKFKKKVKKERKFDNFTKTRKYQIFTHDHQDTKLSTPVLLDMLHSDNPLKTHYYWKYWNLGDGAA